MTDDHSIDQGRPGSQTVSRTPPGAQQRTPAAAPEGAANPVPHEQNRILPTVIHADPRHVIAAPSPLDADELECVQVPSAG
jgi:hypothetical protein